MTLASAFGPFLGLVLNNNLGFSSIFGISLISIVVSFSFTLLIKKLPMNHDIVTEEQSRPKGLSAFLQKEALPISCVVILVGIAYASVLSFLSIYSEMLHLVTASSFFFIVFAVVTFVTRPFTGKIYDHFGENKVMYPVLLSFAIGLAILSMVSSPFLLLLSAAFIGFGYGTIVPTAQAIAIQQSPTSKMGLATSTFYIFVDFGAGMGPFILGLLIPFMGYRYLYLAMAGLIIIAMILYFFVHGRYQKSTSSKD